jgi:uncharacterized iron-regulated protein
VLVAQYRKVARVAAVLAVIAGTAAAGSDRAAASTVAAPPSDWQSTIGRDHALAGRIWSVKRGDWVTWQQVIDDVKQARFVLLGEVHDNPDHHRLQGWAIRALDAVLKGQADTAKRAIGRVAMEMVSEDQSFGLLKFANLNAAQRNPNNFGRLVSWDRSGWPDFGLYEPIVAAALDVGAPIVPATALSDTTRAVSRDGAKALSAARWAELRLDTAYSSEHAEGLRRELVEGHCGMLPETALPKMATVQQFRDAVMADALLKIEPGQVAVLIAGNSHVRRDRGVPRALGLRGVAASDVVTLSFVEVEPGALAPEPYMTQAGAGRLTTDFLWFTPRPDRGDPCDAMRGHMAKKKDAK